MNIIQIVRLLILVVILLMSLSPKADIFEKQTVGTSPWGKDDELGRLNLISPESRAVVMAQANFSKAYDLSVDYFVGMPSWQAAGDPQYQFWMTHTPKGSVVDNVLGMGHDVNSHVSYTGSAISMYTHSGTHIDALNHFGINGEIYNHFSADEYLGDKGWKKNGAETIPPIVARGVLLDIPKAKQLDVLPDNYRITAADLKLALKFSNLELQEGDVVMIRTGRMRDFETAKQYMANSPGLGMEAAAFLANAGAMIVGADNLSFEAFPSEVEGNYVPVHTYLLAQKGIPIIELANLETLSRDATYEFAFVGGSLKLRGADAAPIRPIAFPFKKG
ncbi:MAG: cyclase family protein [Paraglaciecola sp.]|uniref:cyclase family protein n=1 Tax=Paraglaciecola sp. TaxID=1920173 RepID=UPI0032993F4E